MNKAKREALNRAGFRVGTVQDFLGLSDWEAKLVELKYRLSRTVKQLREAHGLTQQAVATKIASSQSRVAKIEAGSADVSLDLLVRYLYAVGGQLRGLEPEVPAARETASAQKTHQRSPRKPSARHSSPAKREKFPVP